MIIDTFNYKVWADERTLQAIESIDASIFSDSYAFVLQQINHIVIVEELFKSRLLNEAAPHKSTNTAVVPSLDELGKRLTKSGAWYLNYVSSLNIKDYEDIVSFVFADGKSGFLTIEEILFHIINHGSYHRGSIAHSLDLAGVPHPPDGYGIYIHEKNPERRISNET